MKLNNKLKTKKRWSKVLLYTLIVTFSFLATAQAQQLTVSGVVNSSDDGMPIPGVAVVIRGTAIGAVTDFDGNYNIQANLKDVLVFSYLGMTNANVTVTGAKMDVTMDPDLEDLEEVVVIGYGAVKKKELTGAVARVKADDIEQFVTTDVASALQGQIAGVNIAASSGEPGENSSIQIRGVTSLSGDNTPLFVVDGIPQIGDPGLTPNEIETIDILKDAASAAVYGTRGAAGVILITTKRGKEGAMNISFDTSYGIQNLGESIALMNTEQQIRFEVAQLENNVSNFIPGPSRNPEWINNDNTFDGYVLVKAADTKRYNLNISGGTKDFSYNAVVGHFNQGGTLINSGFSRTNGRITTTYKTGNWRVNGSLAFTSDERIRTSPGIINSAARYKPYYPEVDPSSDVVITDGNGGVTTPLNILTTALKRKDNSTSNRMNASLSITRDLTENLSFTTRLGSSMDNDIRNIFIPRFTVLDISDGTTEVDPTKSEVRGTAERTRVFSWDASFNYKKNFGNHNLGLQATFALDERLNEGFTASKEGVLNNDIQVLNGATVNPRAISGNNFDEKLIGLLGRVTYDYKGKYLLSALVRRDGSSKFAQENRWGTFPSVSAAWNVSDEKFWKPLKRTINNFKIRTSYGTVGNNSFPNYEFISSLVLGSDYIFDTTDNSVEYGAAIRSFANKDVKWETSISRNIGVDLAFLKNKISLTADYYVTDKEDMLFPVRLPGSTGNLYERDIILNVGNMTNRGLELATRYRTKIGKSRLNLAATYTKNINEVTKIFGSDRIYNSNSQIVNGDGGTSVIAEGYEVGSFFLYETDGTLKDQDEADAYSAKYPSRVNALAGDLKYVDHNEDGDIDIEDRYYHGSGLPDFELGFNLRWTLNNWDLSTNWYASVGAEIINGTKAQSYTQQRHADLTNMWTQDNPTSNIPIFSDQSAKGAFNYLGTTDYWLEDGDYVRLKLITLGYSLPKDVTKKIGISKLRFYISGQNILTFTGYKGYDPEVGGRSPLNRGVDNARYPLASLYTLGFNLKF